MAGSGAVTHSLPKASMANTLLSSTLAARWLLVFCTLSAMLLLLLGHTEARGTPYVQEESLVLQPQYNESGEVVKGGRRLQDFNFGSSSTPTPLAPIVLVGNGPSVLKGHIINGSSLGEIVDSYDEVGRFNLHKTTGFEKLVGSKTTICFMGQLKHPTAKKPKCPRYIVPVVDPKKGISRRRIMQGVKKYYGKKGLGNKLEIMTDHVQKALKRKYKLNAGPSTGIQAILYCAQKYKKVAIAGFDFLHGNHKHYFENKKKKHTTHNMKGEAKVIRQLEAEGKVFVLY